MTLKDYLKHYLAMPDMLKFAVVSLAIVLIIHAILLATSIVKASGFRRDERGEVFDEFFTLFTECYYELMFSSSSILFFTGIYFLIDFNYFHVSERVWAFWMEYQDFLLLGFIVVSMIFNSVLDHWFVPLYFIRKDERNTLRLTAMLYMLIIFAYIKFIYLDDNYNAIVVYFITMVIGRFVYFDASIHDFFEAMRQLMRMLPILLLVLLSTALLSLYGFGTGYLLKSNGVVVSVFIAHFFVILEIFVIARTRAIARIGKNMMSR